MPCDYSKYPKNWKSKIRPDILERDGNCCKFCDVKNYDIGYRDKEGKWYSSKKIIERLENDGYDYFENELKGCFFKNGNPAYATKIVLTIMHLDHNTENNDYSNLAAGCQRCHLHYDRYFHKKNARETLIKNKGLQELF